MATSKEGSSVFIQCDLQSDTISTVGIAKFLARVSPIMFKELSLPCTPVWNEQQGKRRASLSLRLDKTILLQQDEPLADRKVLSAWISSAPLLIALVTTPCDHKLYCDHALEHVEVFAENLKDNLRIPVRACVSVLIANPGIKDILIAGTILGEIYIWKITRHPLSYEEIFYQAGDGMVTALNWLKPLPTTDKAVLLISGQIGGQIVLKTCTYDKQREKVTPGQSYFIDKNTSPIKLIEPISETAFCLYRRGCPLTFFDLNNYTTTTTKERSRTLVLAPGKECRGIDLLLDIKHLNCVPDPDESLSNILLIANNQGDIFSAKTNPVPENATALYRTPHTNLRDCLVVIKPFLAVVCLTTDGALELFDTVTGVKKSVATNQEAIHISVSADGGRFLACDATGSIGVHSLIFE